MTRSLDDALRRMRPDSIMMGLSLAKVTGRPAILADGSVVRPPPPPPPPYEPPRDKPTRDRQRAANARCAATLRHVWTTPSGEVRASVHLADGALISAACRSDDPNDVANALDTAIMEHLEREDRSREKLRRNRARADMRRAIMGPRRRRR